MTIVSSLAALICWRNGPANRSIRPLILKRPSGQALRELRTEKKVSQERLALDAGFDRTYISLVERGVRSPTIRAVVRIAEILKVRPSEMVASHGREVRMVYCPNQEGWRELNPSGCFRLSQEITS